MVNEHGLKEYALSVWDLKGEEVFVMPLKE
jgi:hypothetical protein